MATNRFERPVNNPFTIQYFTPNFEAWNQLTSQYQTEWNTTEAMRSKLPKYIQNSDSDTQGFSDYQSQMLGIRDNMVEAFKKGSIQGRLSMQKAQNDITREWISGGLAYNLESRAAEDALQQQALEKRFEQFQNVLPYASAYRQSNRRGLKDANGNYQTIGNVPMPDPVSTEDFNKFLSDNSKDINATILNDSVIRRYAAGNQYESFYDIILGDEGIAKDRAFQILADLIPNEYKQWFQFKHNAFAYNNPAYDPGDQTSIYTIVDVTDNKGNTYKQMEVNPQSEIAQMIMAKAEGVAYQKRIRTSWSATDHYAIAKAKTRAEEGNVLLTFPGAAVANTANNILSNVKTVQEYRGALDGLNESLAEAAESMKKARPGNAQAIDGILTGFANKQYTAQDVATALANLGVPQQMIGSYIQSHNIIADHEFAYQSMIAEAESKSGFKLANLNDSAQALAQGTLAGKDQVFISGLGNVGVGELMLDLGTGKASVSQSNTQGLSTTPNVSYSRNFTIQRNGKTYTIDENLYNSLAASQQQMRNTDEGKKLINGFSAINNQLNLPETFGGQLVVPVTGLARVPVSDEWGYDKVNMDYVQTQLDNIKEDPGRLANLTYYDPHTGAETQYDLLKWMPDIMTVRDNGEDTKLPDWSNIKNITSNRGYVPGIGHNPMTISYIDNKGAPKSVIVPALTEVDVLVATDGKRQSIVDMSAEEQVEFRSNRAFQTSYGDAVANYGRSNVRTTVPARNAAQETIGAYVINKDVGTPIPGTNNKIMFIYREDGQEKIETDMKNLPILFYRSLDN